MSQAPFDAPLSRFAEGRERQRQTGNPVIDRFLAHCLRRSYPAKSVIIHEGDTPDVLYYLIEGSVAVVIEDEEGKEIVLAYLRPRLSQQGRFLRRDGSVRGPAAAYRRTDCILGEMGYGKFRRLAHEDPDLLFELAGQMAARLKRTSRKVGDLAFLDVTGRIARTLLDLCREPDAMTHPEGMQIRITRQELGRIVGCSREMAGRVLKELEEQGLIQVSGKTIVVLGTR